MAVKVDEVPYRGALDYLADITKAHSRADLSAIWRAASAAGQWDDRLALAGQARLRAIEK